MSDLLHLATCSCGQLKAEARGEPVRVSVCHCLACQQRTGSAFGYQARFPRDKVRITGTATEYIRTADSGNRVRSYFCPVCGTTVHYHLEHVPDLVAIPVGAFADPKFYPPKFTVYESRQHAWVSITSPVEHFD
ncbi:MAG TPA: GFA family protein [Steroidobacteraceae bacterium]|jgi:hypothetical protein|nr:GFA family protein [Steroidobacteraceae bacterium]